MFSPSHSTERKNYRLQPNPATGMEASGRTTDPRKPEKDGYAPGIIYALRHASFLEWMLPSIKGITFEETRKRRLFAAMIVPGTIILSAFGFYHLFHQNLVEGCLDLLACLWLIFSLRGLRVMKKCRVLYRINTTLVGLLFLFLAAKGGMEGNKLLWMFSYPLIAFYTLGIVEGSIWTGIVFLLGMGILFWPWNSQWVHIYSLEFRLRFGAAFALVSVMTCIYESARGKYQSSLEKEQRNLEAEKEKLAEMTHTVQIANRALVQNEQRLKQAQSIARVGNFEYDPETDRLWGSEETLRIFGLDLAGDGLALGDLQARAPDFHHFIQGFETRKQDTCKFRISISGPQGAPIEVKMGFARAEFESVTEASPPKIIGVVQDITALHNAEEKKKELEARLARSQKMEALGLLAGGVAHDLNNVLSGIVSYPDMMLMRLPADSELRKPLHLMRDSGQKAAAIVQDLLTLARRGVTSVEVLNFNDLIDQYMASPEFLKLRSYHPQVAFNVERQARLSNIKASAVHMKKSLMNLVSNAAEALPEGGEVRISARDLHLDRPLKGYTDIPAGEYVVLGVKDNGSGIRQKDLGRIFEPFFTKKEMGRSGTGLGLAVVWGTVHDNNGYINVSSVPAEGTLIELYLPITRQAIERRDNDLPLKAYQGNGERILVVDDMPNQREITHEMLAMLGYHVETASSGEEAIAFLKAHPVDLILLDMIMEPGIDGLETYSRIQGLRPGQKALIVSGYSETERVRKAQKLGAGAYVKKPFDIKTIGLAVLQELEK